MKEYTEWLIVYWTLEKKTLVNLKTEQQTLFKMKQREYNRIKSEQRINEMWEKFKQPNICIIRVLEEGEKVGYQSKLKI